MFSLNFTESTFSEDKDLRIIKKNLVNVNYDWLIVDNLKSNTTTNIDKNLTFNFTNQFRTLKEKTNYSENLLGNFYHQNSEINIKSFFLGIYNNNNNKEKIFNQIYTKIFLYNNGLKYFDDPNSYNKEINLTLHKNK